MSVIFNANHISYTFKDSDSLVVREYADGEYAILEAVIEADEFGGDFRAARDGLFIAREFDFPIKISIRPYVPVGAEQDAQGEYLEPSEIEDVLDVSPVTQFEYGDAVEKPQSFNVQLIGNVSGGAFKIRLIGKV